MRETLHTTVHRIVGMVGGLSARTFPDEVKRVLCLVEGGLGDRLMTLPALRLMRKLYPKAYMCVAWSGESLPEIDIEFDKTLKFSPNDFVFQWKLMRSEWDCLFVNSIGANSITTELVVALSRIPIRIGPRWEYQKQCAYNKSYCLRSNIHLTVLNCSGIGIHLSPQPLSYYVKFEMNRESSHRYIVLHPGGRIAYPGYERNRWQIEKFAELACCLKKIYDIDIYAIIGPGDETVDVSKLESAGVLIKRVISLRELFSIISQAYVFVGNDSGPAHVSAALNVPEVVLFGPSNPLRSAPVSDKAILVCAEAIKPLRYKELNSYKSAPMNGISVDIVLEGIRIAIASEGQM